MTLWLRRVSTGMSIGNAECHDANFVITGGTDQITETNSYDKVGIMTTIGFQYNTGLTLHCAQDGVTHYYDVINGRDGVSKHQHHDCLLNKQLKENIKAPRHWPLWGEFTGDRWIPRTKGQ